MSSRSFSGLPLDGQQRLELLLTAIQSLFAVSILVTLAMTARAAVTLFALFTVQFLASILLPDGVDRVIVIGCRRYSSPATGTTWCAPPATGS